MMMMIHMRIGLVQENYHSEVLAYLLEMYSVSYNAEITVYSNTDAYNNIDMYKHHFSFKAKDLTHLLHDMTSDVCDLFYIISYDNLMYIDEWDAFKSRCVFIAHSTQQANELRTRDYMFVSLAPFLHNVYTIPFTHKPIGIIEATEKSKATAHLELATIGWFLSNNKNTDFLKALLSTGKVMLNVFTNVNTQDLVTLYKSFKDYIRVHQGFGTTKVLQTLKNLDCKTILFAPPPDSDFTNAIKFSGSLAFAFNHKLILATSKEICDNYKLHDPSVVSIDYNAHINHTVSLLQSAHNSPNVFDTRTRITDAIYRENRDKLRTFHSNFDKTM